MPAPPFDLRGLVRQTLRSSDVADLDGLADLVFAAIPANNRAAALRQALRPIVREVISQDRMANPLPSPPAARPGVRSWKVAGVRDLSAALRNRVHAGVEGWKMLADCTRDDLLFAATERRLIADRNNAQAERYDALAQLLTEHDVKTVADLPAEILAPALGAVAA